MQSFRLIIFFLFLVLPWHLSAQSYTNTAKDASMLIEYFNKYHFSPRPIDDAFCQDFYDDFIHTLDPKATIFLSGDIELFTTYLKKPDDLLLRTSPLFLETIATLFNKRLIEVDSLIGTISKLPFDFSVRDTLYVADPKNLKYKKDAAGMKKLWTSRLKYICLSLVMEKIPKEELDNTKPWQKYEADARTQAARIARQQIRKWKVEKEDFKKKLSDIYLNSLASAFDPHSAYFASEDKESFLSNLSTSAFSYGFYVKESDEGSMLVSLLTPGGPAWRSGEIHSGDKVISIQKEGKTETDFSSLGIEEVYEQLMPGNEKYMDVTLISSNDIKKTIRLKKEKLKVEENILQGYLLEGSRKAGYIALPDFFVQEGSNWMLGCANEVAKEILKLKKENIEGIILDLRYNGGGSLKEAIDLAGLFINEGPMMMSAERNQKPQLIKDLNRGTLYDGPLVIMINNYTASAAEVLSMILKDYNRAVIIGTQSYGKATGQNISPLDLSIDPVAYKTGPQNKSLTKFVKITNATLFSVKGVTYQKKGITPDIVFPDINNTQQSYESQYPNAISPDSLNKKLLYTPCPDLPLKELAGMSNKRVEQSWRFRRVKEISDSLQKVGKIKTVPLEWKSFTKWNKNADEVMDQIDSLLNNKEASFTVNNNRFAQDLISVDDYLKEIIDAEIKNIRNDIYIEEAYKTLIDLIQITTKK